MTSPPFFIVGYERSGTTLMAAALDRHSTIAVPPETHFFTDICPPLQAQQTASPDFLLSHFFQEFRSRDLQLDPCDLLLRLTKTKPTWANLFLEALSLYAERNGKQRFGEKTPKHWRCVPDLLSLFADCRVIWVVRDGRDTVLSIMNMPWKPHANLNLHAMQWRFAMERMLAAEAKFPDRILRVKFEDLITAPQPQIARACEFVGVEFEQRQLDPAAQTGVVPTWEMAWKGRVFDAPDPSRIGTAARELPKDSLHMLNLLMDLPLRQLGYTNPLAAPFAAIPAKSAAACAG